MPLYEYECTECGSITEILVGVSDKTPPACSKCGSRKVKKILSAHSSMSGPAKNRLPGPGDTTCCGASPAEAGCAGPGSCCGRR